ncbi:50S ribosomal protein L25 [Candidatus Cytomitobacter indipagum]|uniref:Large ribosomal subunit protein bL25 n=1 Tax=Candidatus Cytomitobacter indipagum TaxID=2601575 RepID=A0A5C0UDL0_9PROT|nr:50S ribosomal protein L25 [Candidatus Cytomitobacter indipagum]QEK37847.1 50S ribosomal protein L25 [Candidatus Cytomitobacter indipagum]
MNINLFSRNIGSKAAKEARKQEKVPVVLYSKNSHEHASIDYKSAKHMLTQPNAMISQLDFSLNNKSYKALIKDVQYHPLSGKPLHIDLFAIEPNRKMTVTLPISFKNKEISPGIKLGGILNVLTKGIKAVVSSDNIPSAINFDLKNSAIGDVIRLKDLEIPTDIQVLRLTENDTLANIIAPSKPKE